MSFSCSDFASSLWLGPAFGYYGSDDIRPLHVINISRQCPSHLHQHEVYNKYIREYLTSKSPCDVNCSLPKSQNQRSPPGDLEFLIACFDSALPYLTSIGSSRQWGTQPFSQRTEWCEEKRGYIEGRGGLEQGSTWIAEVSVETGKEDGGVREWKSAGAIILSTTPPSYVPPQTGSPPVRELYIKNLITDRNLGAASKGFGAKLVDFAREKAREENIELLRLDCWRGGNDGLFRCVSLLAVGCFVLVIIIIISSDFTRSWDLCAWEA